MSKSSLEAAAEAAARVNAMLIAKGKLSPSQLRPKLGNNALGRHKNSAGDLITAEIDINDAPLSARNLLTRGLMQEEICRLSGAAISTRGRYMTPEERQTMATPESRPLYLNIQASSHAAVKAAIRRIQDIINQHFTLSGLPKMPTAGVVTYPTTVSNGSVNSSSFSSSHIPTGSHFVQDKVFIGLEQAPSEYPVREKIIGPNDTFLQHIRSETGATVTLRGKGSGFIEPTSGREAFEPLYIHITHPKPDGLQAAKALAINLVETAHVEFAQWQQTQQQSVLQPLASVVLPQGAPVAYQNQVVVTPTVLPTSLPVSAGVVATSIQIPTSVQTSGTTLTAGLSNLVHASMPTIMTPVTVVSSVPVSVQAIPSNTVITYPTYVANTTPVLARQTPILARSATPAVSLFSMVPAAATAVTHPRSNHIQPMVYASVQPTQNSLVQPSLPTLMTLNQPLNYPVPARYPQHSTVSQPNSLHRYYGSVNIPLSTRAAMPPPNCLQETSNVTPRNTEPAMLRTKRPNEGYDQELMPPPSTFVIMPPSAAAREKQGSVMYSTDERPAKKLKGALVGIASCYGSDDSDDDTTGS